MNKNSLSVIQQKQLKQYPKNIITLLGYCLIFILINRLDILLFIYQFGFCPKPGFKLNSVSGIGQR